MSIEDALEVVLILVIPMGPIVIERLINEILGENIKLAIVKRLIIIQFRVEPRLQIRNGFVALFKAREGMFVSSIHHFYQQYNSMLMRYQSLKSFEKQFSEIPEQFAMHPSQNLQIFMIEFERNIRLESLSRRIRQKKPEIDMHYLPLLLYQNVAVVTVLQLYEIAKQRIACQRATEVFFGFEFALGSGEKQVEKVVETYRLLEMLVKFLFETVHTYTVAQHLDYPAHRIHRNRLVHFQVQFQFLLFENAVELVHQLLRELLLFQIVTRLHQNAYQLFYLSCQYFIYFIISRKITANLIHYVFLNLKFLKKPLDFDFIKIL